MIPIILAGGSGTRFWPLSRRHRPKQFLSILGGDRSMIETTVDRLSPFASTDRPLQIVCRPDLVTPTKQHLPPSGDVEFIEEPVARNTAPAIALATLHIEYRYGDEPIAFFPADHFVGGQDGFERCVHLAARRAQKEAIITLGIPPTRPETGYGYIECSNAIADTGDEPRHHPVKAFVEKPDRQRAQDYLCSGRYLWNSGIFVLKPSTLWKEIRRQQPQMWPLLEEMQQIIAADSSTSEHLEAPFRKLEAISIDYAVMEGARNVEVIPALFRWSDVGHWGALNEVSETDDDNNLVDAEVLLDDVTDSIIVSRNGTRLIAASGLQQMVIVDTEEALLVVPKERAQRVRHLVDELRKRDREDLI